MAKATVELPGIEIDFSEAIVEKATASHIDLELKVKGVYVPGRNITGILVRFEGIKDFEEMWYRLNTKVRRSSRTEFHDPWPLKLPAGLKTLVEVKSRGKHRKFRFAVAEEHFRGRKQPMEFSCKRLSITDLKGKTIAGDVSKISSSKKWNKKDFFGLADEFALAIEASDFKRAHALFEPKLAKSKTLKKFTEQLHRYTRSERNLDDLLKKFRTDKPFKHQLGDDLALPDVLPKRVDPDDVIAVVHTGFIGWFAVNLMITERAGSLQILDYTIDRYWIELF